MRVHLAICVSVVVKVGRKPKINSHILTLHMCGTIKSGTGREFMMERFLRSNKTPPRKAGSKLYADEGEKA